MLVIVPLLSCLKCFWVFGFKAQQFIILVGSKQSNLHVLRGVCYLVERSNLHPPAASAKKSAA